MEDLSILQKFQFPEVHLLLIPYSYWEWAMVVSHDGLFMFFVMEWHKIWFYSSDLQSFYSDFTYDFTLTRPINLGLWFLHLLRMPGCQSFSDDTLSINWSSMWRSSAPWWYCCKPFWSISGVDAGLRQLSTEGDREGEKRDKLGHWKRENH